MEKIDLLKNNNVEVDASLEFWGDLNSYNENLKEFNDSLEQKLNDLEYYKNNADWNNYAIVAHSTKSEAKYLGFMSDSEVFLSHELKGKEQDSDYINNNFDTLKNTILKIQKILNEYFKEEKKKILIADDSNIILNFIEKNISNEYDCIKASNGKVALEKIENDNLYAILLDLNMPSLNGFQVLEHMQVQSLFEKIPVVIITGDDSENTIKEAFRYPILDIINKPFNEENIKRILTSIKNFYER
ncbi:MAG: response regulator [Ruminococcus sp.]|nr:response regulator [Ruminococcus sp.]